MGMKQIVAAAMVASALVATSASAATVSDAFTLTFGAGSTSSNDPLTGASGTATFGFMDEMGDVRVSVKVRNTTGSTTFGAGATQSALTGFGFDLLMGTSVASPGSFLSTGSLDTFLLNADFNPFGKLDVAFADNNNFNGGNANDAVDAGEMSVASFLLATDLDAAGTARAFQTGFFSDGLQAGLRFQQVNAGEGSDKLVFEPPMTPPPPPAVVPLPAAGVLLLAGLAGLGAMRRRG